MRDLVERMLSKPGRCVDLSTPFVDASLPDGSRLQVASGDVARGAMSLNIHTFSRRFSQGPPGFGHIREGTSRSAGVAS